MYAEKGDLILIQWILTKEMFYLMIASNLKYLEKVIYFKPHAQIIPFRTKDNNKIDNKRRNETYKRLWDTQNQKIKDLEDTVQRVNSESNEMKKDMKIMVELRNYLQKKVTFLEEENRRFRERNSNPNNKTVTNGHTNINQRGWDEHDTHSRTKNLHIVESEMIDILHSPIRGAFDRGDMKHYTSNNESAMNSIDHKHGSPEKGTLVLDPQILCGVDQLELQPERKPIGEFRAGPHNTLVENSFESVRRAREKVRLNALEIVIPEENEDGYGSSRELNLSEGSNGKRTVQGSKRKLRVQIKPKTFVIDGGESGWYPNSPPSNHHFGKRAPELSHHQNEYTGQQQAELEDRNWPVVDYDDGKEMEAGVEVNNGFKRKIRSLQSFKIEGSRKKNLKKIPSRNLRQKGMFKKSIQDNTQKRNNIGIMIPETNEEPMFKVQSTRINKKIYFDHENGGLSFCKKSPGDLGGGMNVHRTRVKCHKAGQHSQSQFKKMKDMIFEKKRVPNKRSAKEQLSRAEPLKRTNVPHKISWRNLKINSQTHLAGDGRRRKPQVAFTSHKRIMQQNLIRGHRDSAQRLGKTNFSNRRGDPAQGSGGYVKNHTPKISFTGLGPGGGRGKRVRRRRKTTAQKEVPLRHSQARSTMEAESSLPHPWGKDQEYYDLKPSQKQRTPGHPKIIPRLGSRNPPKGTSLRLFESGDSLESDLSKRRMVIERVKTEPMSLEVEGEYFQLHDTQSKQDRNNCSISVNEVCFDQSTPVEKLKQLIPTENLELVKKKSQMKAQRKGKIMSTGKLGKESFGSSLKLGTESRNGPRRNQNVPEYHSKHKNTSDVAKNNPLASQTHVSRHVEPAQGKKQKVFRHNSRSPNFSKRRPKRKDTNNNIKPSTPMLNIKRKILPIKRTNDLTWREKSAREAGMETDRTGKRIKEPKRKLRLTQTGKAAKPQVRGMRLSVTSGKERGVHDRNKNHVFQQSLRYYQKQQSLRNRKETGLTGGHPRLAQELDLGFGGFRQAMAQANLNKSKPSWAFQRSEIIGEKSPKVKVTGARKRKTKQKRRSKRAEDDASPAKPPAPSKQINRQKRKKDLKSSKKKRHKIPARNLNFKKTRKAPKSETPKFNIINNIQIEQVSNEPLDSIVDHSDEPLGRTPFCQRHSSRQEALECPFCDLEVSDSLGQMNNTFEERIDGQVLYDLQNNFYSCKNISKDLNLHEEVAGSQMSVKGKGKRKNKKKKIKRGKKRKKLSTYSEFEERGSTGGHHSELLGEGARKVLGPNFLRMPIRVRKKKKNW